MEKHTLRKISIEEIPEPSLRLFDPDVDAVARNAIERVRTGGEAALREMAVKFDSLGQDAPLVISRKEMKAAYDALPPETAALLGRAKDRIAAFAAAQRACLAPLDMAIGEEGAAEASLRSGTGAGASAPASAPQSAQATSAPASAAGAALRSAQEASEQDAAQTRAQVGRHGHDFVPVARAGCYVPGGAFPLPSSALMTIVPAKVAGVAEVWAAGPKPSRETLAAAWLAGADGFLRCGGSHAIAALAFRVAVTKCDVIVGPGGKSVAAAKRLLFGVVGTEAPAGPSELLVIADESADPRLIAADLLAQAEHSTDAMPALIATDSALANRVEAELERQLEELPEPNKSIARAALANGFLCVEPDLERAAEGANRCAPEHLELAVASPRALSTRIKNAGALFLESGSAEVFGDYGVGPNHTLPTGGASKFAAGLSVLHFLRARTWLEVDDPRSLIEDTAAFARIEGLEAHARAAEARRASRRDREKRNFPYLDDVL